jgi:hypothetical protein
MLLQLLIQLLWANESIFQVPTLEYFDCNDNKMIVNDDTFPIQADATHVIYKIKPSNWEELEKRSIVLYRTSDNAIMWKSDAKDLPSCLILKGTKIKNILESQASLKIVTEFPQDALMEVRTSSVDLSKADHFKFFGSGLKFVEIDISHVRESRMQQIYLDYVYSSTLRSIENEGEQSLIRMNQMVVSILSDMQTMNIEQWSSTQIFTDFKRSTQVMAKFVGLPQHDVAMKAHIRGLGVGDSLQILRNLIKVYEILIFKRKYFDTEKVNNLNTVITNIMGIYEQEFKYLCSAAIDFKLPFVDTEKLNVYEAFNFVLKRVNNLLKINSYESHRPLLELLHSFGKKGLTYKQAIADPNRKAQIVSAYEKVKISSVGLPSHALAQAEINKLRDLSSGMKDLEIYKELFEDLQLGGESIESDYFMSLRKQLDLLQSGADIEITDTQILESKLNTLLQNELHLVNTLKAKAAKLAEIMAYLDEVDKNVKFVGQFCPASSQSNP